LHWHLQLPRSLLIVTSW